MKKNEEKSISALKSYFNTLHLKVFLVFFSEKITLLLNLISKVLDFKLENVNNFLKV